MSDSLQIVTYHFQFSESGLKVERIEIRADSATFENGRINWMVCSDSTCAMLRGMFLSCMVITWLFTDFLRLW